MTKTFVKARKASGVNFSNNPPTFHENFSNNPPTWKLYLDERDDKAYMML
ncbi:Integrase [Salmonella enterica subsp. enterica serovar Give str. S5-487]|nr:Integrase [Salmonella enterica subsp. enterica serovar Give str. S5-487]